MTFYHASLDTHDRFDAFGATRQQALAALKQGYEVHCQTNPERDTFADLKKGGSVHCIPVSLDKCYRYGVHDHPLF